MRFIVNARSGRAARVLPSVQAFAGRRGADVVVTQQRGHGAELAAQAITDGCDLIVAVGGDGTMNEVASALVGGPATLGLVPCGSGDGLGRHLGIHGTPAHALALLEHGQPRVIDTGTAEGHPFFTVAGIGFEAEIAHRFNQLTRRGFARYVSTSAALWREWDPPCYRISHAGRTEEIRACTLAVANAGQWGNNARIAPSARIDDGLLNLTAVPDVTAWNLLPLVVRLFTGNITGGRNVFSRTGERFRVERQQSGWLHTDGELHEAGRVIEFQIRPASLRIMVGSDHH